VKAFLDMANKHRHLMKTRKEFSRLFGVDISQFYSDPFLGFDVIAFDAWVKKNHKDYHQRESLRSFIGRKFGIEAAERVASLI
jgi:hypothetical protein